MDGAEMKHFLIKAREAKLGGDDAQSVQSTGEKLAVALVLNRADWLERMNYTIGEALERIGTEWVALPHVERALRTKTE